MFAPGVFPWLAALIALLAGGGAGLWLSARKAHATQQVADLFEQQLADSQRVLAERDARIAANAQELRTLRSELDATQRRVAATDLDIAAARQRTAEIEPLVLQLHDRDSQLVRLNTDLDAVHDHYASEIGDLRRRLGDNDALRTQLARADQQLHALDARLAHVQRDKDLAIAGLSTRLAELEPLAPQAERSPPPAAAPIAGDDATPRELRVRELEHELARLRQRILQLDALHGALQRRDEEIERLKYQIEELRQ